MKREETMIDYVKIFVVFCLMSIISGFITLVGSLILLNDYLVHGDLKLSLGVAVFKIGASSSLVGMIGLFVMLTCVIRNMKVSYVPAEEDNESE